MKFIVKSELLTGESASRSLNADQQIFLAPKLAVYCGTSIQELNFFYDLRKIAKDVFVTHEDVQSVNGSKNLSLLLRIKLFNNRSIHELSY